MKKWTGNDRGKLIIAIQPERRLGMGENQLLRRGKRKKYLHPDTGERKEKNG